MNSYCFSLTILLWLCPCIAISQNTTTISPSTTTTDLVCRNEPPPFQCLKLEEDGIVRYDLRMMHYVDKSRENVLKDCERYAGRYNRLMQEFGFVLNCFIIEDTPGTYFASFTTGTMEECRNAIDNTLNKEILAKNTSETALFTCWQFLPDAVYMGLDDTGKSCSVASDVVVEFFRPNLELATIPPSYTDIEKEYYTDPRGDTHFVTGGVLYRFKPPEIDEKTSNLTCGQFSDLMYTISTNASSAFVQANTGIIVCTFEEPGFFEFVLLASDLSRNSITTVDSYVIEVHPPIAFKLVTKSTRTESKELLTEEEFKLIANLGESQLLDPTTPRTYFPQRVYRFGPLEIDREKTVVSGGTIDDITFRLQNAPFSVFINEKGVIYGEFPSATGPGFPVPYYEFSILAVDKRASVQVMETFRFHVSPTPRLVVFTKDTPRLNKTSYDQVYDSLNQMQYFVDRPYLFAPPIIDGINTRVTDGTIDDLRYSLQGSPGILDSFFVNPKSGEIFGIFLTVGENISIKLEVQDLGGSSVILEEHFFNVEATPVFGLSSAWNPNLITENILPIYALGGTYQIPPPLIRKEDIFVNANGNAAAVTYYLRCFDKSKSRTECPGDFLVDGELGLILIRATQNVRNVTAMFGATDGAGATVDLKTWEFSVVPNDTATEENGPNGRGCGNGITVDGDPFDSAFTCECPDGYEQPNCDPVDEGNPWLIAGSVVAFLLFVICAVVVGLRYYGYSLRYRPVDFGEKYKDLVESGEFDKEQLDAARLPREVRRRVVQQIEVIGKGAFGEVWKAMIDESQTGGPPGYLIAVKTVLENKATQEATEELLQEASIMAQVSPHPNLVQLVGVVTRGLPRMLLMSYCEHGSLVSFLKSRSEAGEFLDKPEQMALAMQIAAGMNHLHQHHFIHRDLAARNVLLASGMICKVADFGLSRGAQSDNEGNEYYRSSKGVFPVRWTAPEAMETLKFSMASDTWSYGITVIEVFQHGIIPYFGKSNAEVMNHTMAGKCHERPRHCPQEIFAILCKCWAKEPDKRPTFEEIIQMLKKVDEKSQFLGPGIIRKANIGLRGVTGGVTTNGGTIDSLDKGNSSGSGGYVSEGTAISIEASNYEYATSAQLELQRQELKDSEKKSSSLKVPDPPPRPSLKEKNEGKVEHEYLEPVPVVKDQDHEDTPKPSQTSEV
eukprot:m.173389 g.173389  ORF g.173389 m.173389 type:complete len:1180 (+) comp15387_c0_seq2:3773-7312(+)